MSGHLYPPDVCHLDAGLDALLAHVPRLGELQETQHQLVDLLHVDAASTVLVKHVEYPTKMKQYEVKI